MLALIEVIGIFMDELVMRGIAWFYAQAKQSERNQ